MENVEGKGERIEWKVPAEWLYREGISWDSRLGWLVGTADSIFELVLTLLLAACVVVWARVRSIWMRGKEETMALEGRVILCRRKDRFIDLRTPGLTAELIQRDGNYHVEFKRAKVGRRRTQPTIMPLPPDRYEKIFNAIQSAINKNEALEMAGEESAGEEDLAGNPNGERTKRTPPPFWS